jgi:hypothetical protein
MQEPIHEVTHAYRAYLLDHKNHIVKRIDVKATSDEEACVAARQVLETLSEYPAIEVWDGARSYGVFRGSEKV